MGSWGILLLVMLIAVANLGVGFAVGVYMRLDLAERLRGKLPRPGSAASRWPLPAWRRQDDEAPSDEPAAREPDAGKAAQAADPAPQPAKEILDSREQIEEFDMDESLPLEVALAQLQQDISAVRTDLVEIDRRVHACADDPSAGDLEECKADLQNAGERYLQRQESALKVLRDSAADREEDTARSESIRHAASEQASQIRDTLKEFGHWDITSDNLEENCRRLLAETGKMIQSCEAISATVERAAERPPSPAPDAEEDARGAGIENPGAPGGALPQCGIVAAVRHWWADDPDQQRPLTLAVIDADQVDAKNRQFGREAVDRLLKQVGETVYSAAPAGGAAYQVNAQQFVLLLASSAAAECAERVEDVRQAIARCRIDSDGEPVGITASCGVVIANDGDTPESLADRAAATLLEAKEFGENRTFLHEGGIATPVVSIQSQSPSEATPASA